MPLRALPHLDFGSLVLGILLGMGMAFVLAANRILEPPVDCPVALAAPTVTIPPTPKYTTRAEPFTP